jgi:P27 family predicted phage terminase small subunit
MGKRGPQPKPQQLKEMEGNPGKRPLNEDAPAATGAPDLPSYLGDYAREVWQLISESMPPGLYAKCDTSLLVAYCEAADLHRRAVLAVREEGEVATGSNGSPYQNPWVSIQNKQAQLLATLGSRLGLDPAARSSLSLPSKDKPKSKFGDLIPIKGGRNE